MKKILVLALAVVMLAGCEKIEVQDENPAKSTVTFRITAQDWDVSQGARTRGDLSADGQTMTDLWLFDYVDGELLQTVHQSSGDDDFGEPSVSLSRGEHTVVFVASRGQSPKVDEDEGVITWATPRDTFWAVLDLDVDGSSVSESVTLARVATRATISIQDEIPADAATIEFRPSRWFYGLELMTGRAVEESAKLRTVTIPTSYKGTTGQMSASFFGLSGASEWQTDITIRALDDDGEIINYVSVAAVPFVRNKTTRLSGTLFSRRADVDVDLQDSWGESYSVGW